MTEKHKKTQVYTNGKNTNKTKRARLILAPRLSDRLIDQSVTRSNRSRMPMFEDSAFDWGGRTNHSESGGNSETKTFTIHI